MAQTIKSLQQQINKISIDGFNVKTYKKGDYGYNLIYGLLDDNVEVAFKVPYQNESEDAVNNISKILDANVNFVRFIKTKLLPKDCTLVKFIDGEYLVFFQIGFEISGKTLEFYMPWVYYVKNYKAPIHYSSTQIVKNIKKSINNYKNNFKYLLNSTDFKYEDHSVVSGISNSNYNSLDLKINGSAFGVNGSFIVKDFENANIKKILKQQLKIFKDKSKGKQSKIDENDLIDLRSYTELIAALSEEERLTKQYNKNKIQQRQNARDTFCKTKLIPLAKKIFNEINAKFIDWKIGEEISWDELFPENFFEDCDYNDIRLLTLILEDGFTGQHIWANNVITTSGQILDDKRQELLKLGKDIGHNLGNTYMIIRDDDLILDKNNRIVYNEKPGYNGYSKKLTIEEINDNVKRLTHNIKIFKTNEDRYKANAMIAIYYNFLGENEKSKNYKKIVEDVKMNDIELDEKIETLLLGIK